MRTTMMLKNNPRLLFIVCIVVGTLAVHNGVVEGETWRSLRAEEKPTLLIDVRPVCAGALRGGTDEDELRDPYFKNPVYALHLGRDTQYGQTNNKIIELFHAVDTAMESGGLTVVAISGWAFSWMSKFFPDEDSWKQLERDYPIVRASFSPLKLDALKVKTVDFLSRQHDSLKIMSGWEEVQARRLKFLHYMFSNLEGEPCKFKHEIQAHLRSNFNETRYIAVHVRDLDGMCEMFNGDNPFVHEQCAMSPAYIKSILEAHGITERFPVVLLTDMHDEEKLHRIQDELDQVVVPEWDLAIRPSMLADLVVGSMSEIFIGERASTASRNIALLREAFGKVASTNYVFMNKTDEGKWTSWSPHDPYEQGL